MSERALVRFARLIGLRCELIALLLANLMAAAQRSNLNQVAEDPQAALECQTLGQHTMVVAVKCLYRSKMSQQP